MLTITELAVMSVLRDGFTTRHDVSVKAPELRPERGFDGPLALATLDRLKDFGFVVADGKHYLLTGHGIKITKASAKHFYELAYKLHFGVEASS
ncbi:hypothetical protein [Myxococcus phage Mx1]|nr:hypothetical protein [Myxococcus phage Mx1]